MAAISPWAEMCAVLAGKPCSVPMPLTPARPQPRPLLAERQPWAAPQRVPSRSMGPACRVLRITRLGSDSSRLLWGTADPGLAVPWIPAAQRSPWRRPESWRTELALPLTDPASVLIRERDLRTGWPPRRDQVREIFAPAGTSPTDHRNLLDQTLVDSHLPRVHICPSWAQQSVPPVSPEAHDSTRTSHFEDGLHEY
jgi:hypothetical protein